MLTRYEPDEPGIFEEFSVSLRFDAKGFEGAIEPMGGGPADYRRLNVEVSLDASLAAIERFGAELERETADIVQEYEREWERLERLDAAKQSNPKKPKPRR